MYIISKKGFIGLIVVEGTAANQHYLQQLQNEIVQSFREQGM
jgi:hypothetical protein